MNKYAPHVYVIPEDDANRQLADGFVLHHQVKDLRIQVVPPAGGWPKVREIFQEEYVSKLRGYPQAHVVMLIDFDDEVEQRRAAFEAAVPEELKGRVFVIGTKVTPETLSQVLGRSFEKIGADLADECAADTVQLWEHEQLRHNESDRHRMVQIVRPFLF
jgi:hypothetical protein